MTARDYMAMLDDLMSQPLPEGESFELLELTTAAIGQQLSRIADHLERTEPDATMRAYLAREGRL
jgi:hypothetical protein